MNSVRLIILYRAADVDNEHYKESNRNAHNLLTTPHELHVTQNASVLRTHVSITNIPDSTTTLKPPAFGFEWRHCSVCKSDFQVPSTNPSWHERQHVRSKRCSGLQRQRAQSEAHASALDQLDSSFPFARSRQPHHRAASDPLPHSVHASSSTMTSTCPGVLVEWSESDAAYTSRTKRSRVY